MKTWKVINVDDGKAVLNKTWVFFGDHPRDYVRLYNDGSLFGTASKAVIVDLPELVVRIHQINDTLQIFYVEPK